MCLQSADSSSTGPKAAEAGSPTRASVLKTVPWVISHFVFYHFPFPCPETPSSLFTYLCWAARGLCCSADSPLAAENGGLSSCRALALEPGLGELRLGGSPVEAPGLQSTSAIAVAHRPSCSAAGGIVPDPGSNAGLPHRQADAIPLSPSSLPMQLVGAEGHHAPVYRAALTTLPSAARKLLPSNHQPSWHGCK